MIVQSDAMTHPESVVLVVPVTTNMSAMQFSGSVAVAPDGTNGLTHPSVLLVTQLRAIDRKLIVRALGRLAASDMNTLENQLARILGLPFLRTE